MPVLSFPCTLIPRVQFQKRAPFQMYWIKGFDLRELALAATKLLESTPDECGYALYTAKTSEPAETVAANRTEAHAAAREARTLASVLASASSSPSRPATTQTRVYLEVVRPHPHASAIVGPMDGPRPPAILSPERCYSLDELVAQVQVADGPDAEAAYAVIVKHAAIFGDAACPPPHKKNGESREEYAQRTAPMEHARRARAQYEGMHVIHYDVPPELWRAADLDMLMALIYRLLPTHEPRWREVGSVTQETFAGDRPGGAPTYQYSLQVARGDYIAYLRLPQFPTTALGDWLRTRKCEINLCHPIVSVEALARACC